MHEVQHLGNIHRLFGIFLNNNEKYMFYLFQIKSILHPKFYQHRASSDYMENSAISHTE